MPGLCREHIHKFLVEACKEFPDALTSVLATRPLDEYHFLNGGDGPTIQRIPAAALDMDDGKAALTKSDKPYGDGDIWSSLQASPKSVGSMCNK